MSVTFYMKTSIYSILTWIQKRVVSPSSADSANSVQGSLSRVQNAKGIAMGGEETLEKMMHFFPLKDFIIMRTDFYLWEFNLSELTLLGVQ